MSVGRGEEETDFCRYVRSPIHLESQHCVCCKITSALSPEEFSRRMYGEIYRYSEAIPVLFKKNCLAILDNRFVSRILLFRSLCTHVCQGVHTILWLLDSPEREV